MTALARAPRLAPARSKLSAPTLGRISLLGLLLCWLVACGPGASFHLELARTKQTPPDASVTIDEQYVAMLGEITARGIRLPEGEHRITVERDGYFPWDRIVLSDGKPIRLEVDLVPLPD